MLYKNAGKKPCCPPLPIKSIGISGFSRRNSLNSVTSSASAFSNIRGMSFNTLLHNSLTFEVASLTFLFFLVVAFSRYSKMSLLGMSLSTLFKLVLSGFFLVFTADCPFLSFPSLSLCIHLSSVSPLYPFSQTYQP